MKKFFVTAAALTLTLGASAQGNNTAMGGDHEGCTSLAERVLKLEKKNDAFNVYINYAASFQETDNGTEFTNALLATKSKHKTLFESALLEMGIAYHRIQIATPRHNGKVERQHRTDELRFYRHMRMYSLKDGRRQLAVYQRQSNDHIMTCLDIQSPNQVLAKYAGVMW